MKVPLKVIELAVKEAIKSKYRIRVGAVIFNRKTVISTGHNYALKSVRSITKKFVKYRYSVHAEVDALLRARTDLNGASILVVRINNKGELRYSRPCKECNGYLNHVKIKNIFYSTNEGIVALT